MRRQFGIATLLVSGNSLRFTSVPNTLSLEGLSVTTYWKSQGFVDSLGEKETTTSSINSSVVYQMIYGSNSLYSLLTSFIT